MNETKYTVVPFTVQKPADEGFWGYEEENRFAIANPEGRVIDDAQGYGYKTVQAAHKAAWYKLNGGKNKIAAAEKEVRTVLKKRPEIKDFVMDCLEIHVKETHCRPERNFFLEMAKAVQTKFSVSMSYAAVKHLVNNL